MDIVEKWFFYGFVLVMAFLVITSGGQANTIINTLSAQNTRFIRTLQGR